MLGYLLWYDFFFYKKTCNWHLNVFISESAISAALLRLNKYTFLPWGLLLNPLKPSHAHDVIETLCHCDTKK